MLWARDANCINSIPRESRRPTGVEDRSPTDSQPTRGQQCLLNGQVVLEGEIARLFAANNPGHVRRVGDVALVLRESHLLYPFAVVTARGGEGDARRRVVERLD